MAPEQTCILNTLLTQSPNLFHTCEINFLVLVSRYLRYALLSRPECIAIEYILEHVYGEDPTEDPGIVCTFSDYNTTPITTPDTPETGGVGGVRPSGCGDGLDPLCEETYSVIDTFIIKDRRKCIRE